MPKKMYYKEIKLPLGGRVFEVKDSGAREHFASGMQRDTQSGKTLYSLVYSGPMLKRWAEHLTKGAEKYSRDNWMNAAGEEELTRFLDSAARHFAQWMVGDRDEDHAAAVFFNLNGAEYVREKMQNPDSAALSDDNECWCGATNDIDCTCKRQNRTSDE